MSHLLVLNHSVYQKQTIRCEVDTAACWSCDKQPGVMNIVKRADVFKKRDVMCVVHEK